MRAFRADGEASLEHPRDGFPRDGLPPLKTLPQGRRPQLFGVAQQTAHLSHPLHPRPNAWAPNPPIHEGRIPSQKYVPPEVPPGVLFPLLCHTPPAPPRPSPPPKGDLRPLSVGEGGRQQPAQPQYANYWAPLTRKRHIPPHPAQPQHTNHGAPRMRKRHQQEYRPQRPTENSNPMQHAKGRTGDCPGPHKETTTRRNVTQGVVSQTLPPLPPCLM